MDKGGGYGEGRSSTVGWMKEEDVERLVVPHRLVLTDRLIGIAGIPNSHSKHRSSRNIGIRGLLRGTQRNVGIRGSRGERGTKGNTEELWNKGAHIREGLQGAHRGMLE